MRSIKHSFFFLVLAGVFFFYEMNTLALFLGALGLIKLVKWFNHPHRILWSKVEHDAKKFNISIPDRLNIKQNLLQLYSKVEMLGHYHPYATDSLNKMLNAMWQNLKYNTNLLAWSKEISYTTKTLPQFNKGNFESRLQQLKSDAMRDQELWYQAGQKARIQ